MPGCTPNWPAIVAARACTASLLLLLASCAAAVPGPTAVVDRVAVLDGDVVTLDDLVPRLVEASGREVLRAIVLEHALDRLLAARGVVLSPGMIEAEHRLLLASLHEDREVAARLLADLRSRRGLGPRRFDLLLRRTAGLRVLVRDEVVITEEAIERLHDIEHGARRTGRILVLPDLDRAVVIARRIAEGEDPAALALMHSMDPSAERGGLVEPIGREDPRWPAALRRVLFDLEPGRVSDPILLEDRWVLLVPLEEIEPDDVSLGSVRVHLEQTLRRRQERLLMDRLSGELVADTEATFFDRDLEGAWDESHP